MKKLIALLLLLSLPAQAVIQTEVRNPRGEDLRTDSEQRGTWVIELGTQTIRDFIDEWRKDQIVISTLNTSGTITLAAGEIFQGATEEILEFQGITVTVFGTPAVASGTFTFEFSPDCINFDTVVPSFFAGPRAFVPFPLRTVNQCFRVSWLNNSTPLTEFRLFTHLHRNAPEDLTRTLFQQITRNEPVKIIRSFQGGESPDGVFVNLPASGIHSANTTTIPLLGDETFTGEFLDITLFSGVAITVFPDAPGTLFADYSLDGIETAFSTDFIISSGMPSFFEVSRESQFMRVRYANGASTQTAFILTSIPTVTPGSPQVAPLIQPLQDNNVAGTVKAVLVAKDRTTGEYAPIFSDNNRLEAVIPPPTAPAGTTPEREISSGDVSTLTDTVFVIDASSNVVVRRFSGGCEVGNGGSKSTLFEDADGTGVTLRVLSVGYCDGNNFSEELAETIIGDGSRAIRTRRERFGGGSVDMTAIWQGQGESK